MTLLLHQFQAMAVFFVLFHVYARSRAFRPQRDDWLRARSRLSIYVFFSVIAILGSYLGTRLEGGVIANTRAVGAVLAGLLGGPLVGGAVGVTAGLHRISLGGSTALAGAIATTTEGLACGLVHLALRRTPDRIIDWKLGLAVTAVGEVVHMGIVLAVTRPLPVALAAVQVIAPPMVLINPAGVALFMTILRDRFNLYDRAAAASSAQALKVAQRTLGLLAKGFTAEAAGEMAKIIREETGVGAVAITDRDQLLAFTGIGSDHHVPGGPISNRLTRRSIDGNEVVFADGEREGYDCSLDPSCRLASLVSVPLEADGAVIGTVQLLEPKDKRFLSMNRSLGEGLAQLLSAQLLLSRYLEQKNLLVTQELKLIQAQVNPHFLFNSLNTIGAITRRQPERARELLVHLSTFLRKNLKRSADLSTLEEELEHVSSYLEIEKARFQDRLIVETDVDPGLLKLRLPTFTLQPLIENAIKHGLSTTIARGTARIHAYREDGNAVIDIEDDAGAWVERPDGGGGLGLKIVDKRIKNLLGGASGVTVHCVPHELTRVTVRIPLGEARA
jgi:two-component system LytT family sensor kinase